VDVVFNAIYDIQSSPTGEANISYQRDLTKISNTTSFDLNLGLSFTAVALEVGGGVGFEQGKKMTVENGKWIYGKKYINQEFTSEIPNVPVSYQTVLQEIIDEVPLWLRLLIGTFNVLIPGKDDQTFYLGDNGSYIVFPDNAFPTGVDSLHCASWSWYGNSPAKKLVDVVENKKYIFKENKKDAEEAYGMVYGIGGFYQFEPYGTPLPDTAWITIVYDQAEADSLDESSLGMYWEDKSNHQWVYLGGILDTINNTVTAPVTQLSLFTLAPAMPFGNFGLNATPDSIYADSISFSVILSDTIFNNNLTPVGDGIKFTVTTDYGRIISQDIDTAINGVQVLSATSRLQFNVLSNHVAGIATISAYSVNGSASGETQVVFYDTIPPSAPIISELTTGNKQAILKWLPNIEADLAGYKIYYDTDTLLPLEGIHTVYGESSPIITGIDTTMVINGLFNDSTYYFAVSAFDVSGNESLLSEFLSGAPGGRFVDLKVFLEGPFDGISEMKTGLNESEQLPLSQPYNAAPWYYSGSESVTSIPGAEVIDWVLIEYRQTSGDVTTAIPTTRIRQQAGFLLNDGSIVNKDGTSLLNFDYEISANLFVVIYHRNHLPIISANPVTLNNDTYNYDFSSGSSQVYGGTEAVKVLTPGIWGMIAADGNADGLIDDMDKNIIWASQAGEKGYNAGDFNLDTEVDNKDKDDKWVPNEGKGSQLPD
jgi:hypothetical protein